MAQIATHLADTPDRRLLTASGTPWQFPSAFALNCLMRLNPNGLVVAAVFYGLLWYALEGHVDYDLMWALVLLGVNVMVGWLVLGALAGSSWPLRRPRKRDARMARSSR